MNKKATEFMGEGLFLFWRLMLLVMLVLFVALTAGAAFSSKQDVRGLEASILADKISDCISKNGTVSSDFSLDNCFLNDNELYVGVNVTSFDGSFSRLVEKGDITLDVYYNLVPAEKGKKHPFFLNQKSYTLISNQSNVQQGTMEVLVGIKKYDANV